MTVRISFWALDLRPFEEFLRRSLGDVLVYIAENGGEETFVSFFADPGFYVASPSWGIYHDPCVGGQSRYTLSQSDIATDPRLSVSCWEHLNQGQTTELHNLVRALADTPGVAWVQELSTDYYKRWWICSLLDWLDQADVLPGIHYTQYEALFRKVLRGCHCGKSLRGPEIDLWDLVFPVIPELDNGGASLGVWTAEEIALFVRRTKFLLSLEPDFGPPPRLRYDSDDGTDWNEWVRMMLAQLLKIEALGFREPNMVSFISQEG